MQLERSQSSEAGLAGWISSNDVTLFTMVLVVVIALFLHSILNRREAQLLTTNEELELKKQALLETQDSLDEALRQRDTLDEELSATTASLNSARTELDELDVILAQRKRELEKRQRELSKLADDLQVTRDQRDQLNTDLDRALKNIAALKTDIGSLTSQKRDLEAEKTQLVETRDALSLDKASLAQKLAALTSQLQQKVTALQDAEKERDRLRKQTESLDAIVATMQKKLNLAEEDLEKAKTASVSQLAAAEAQIRDLETKTKGEKARAEDYLARLRRAAELFEGLKAEKKSLQTEVSSLEQRYQQQVTRKAVISRELVGVKGKLRRVAFVFDASGSMKEHGMSEVNRWLEAQQIASTWLSHLEVDECVLVIFSTNVRTFPDDGSYLKVSGPDAEKNRARLLEHLNALEPQGLTNTLEAFRTAYRYQGLDTIVLFSDGAPSNSRSGQFDPQIAQQVYALCRQHADVPVNTVGLGNYFDQNMGTFLRNVARLTGGTFRGR
jgi:myosin heavy subunit